jgi:hypothetical protein
MIGGKVENLEQSNLIGDFEAIKEDTEILQVLKELFDKEKIALISDLDEDEIRLSTRILTLGKMKGLIYYEIAVKLFMELMLSRKRKSRIEIIDAVKGFAERFRFMNKFMRPPGSMQQM